MSIQHPAKQLVIGELSQSLVAAGLCIWYKLGSIYQEPDYIVPGHTHPIIGKEKITEMLTNYRDAIRFVFDKTIKSNNKNGWLA